MHWYLSLACFSSQHEPPLARVVVVAEVVVPGSVAKFVAVAVSADGSTLADKSVGVIEDADTGTCMVVVDDDAAADDDDYYTAVVRNMVACTGGAGIGDGVALILAGREAALGTFHLGMHIEAEYAAKTMLLVTHDQHHAIQALSRNLFLLY